MENNQRALNYLGLARRGSNLVYGEETVGAACRAGHVRLLIVAKDAGEHTYRRAKSYVNGKKIPLRPVRFTKEELGAALGIGVCAIAAVTDVALARAFIQALGETEKDAELLQELDRRVQRVVKRRQEEKAHEKNVRRGGKKRPVHKEKESAE